MTTFKIIDDLGYVHGLVKANTAEEAIDVYLSPSKILPAPNQSLRSIIKAIKK